MLFRSAEPLLTPEGGLLLALCRAHVERCPCGIVEDRLLPRGVEVVPLLEVALFLKVVVIVFLEVIPLIDDVGCILERRFFLLGL